MWAVIEPTTLATDKVGARPLDQPLHINGGKMQWETAERLPS